MLVAHLCLALESHTSREYVEKAASRVSSWVNFVRIPAGEKIRLGSDTLSISSSQPSKVYGSKTIRNTKKEGRKSRFLRGRIDHWELEKGNWAERDLNSFEPLHLQSCQQLELRGEPCLHNLSRVHYWSAAKESQVLQSKIVNEVARVRPIWVNIDSLHPNYTPLLPELESPSATTEISTFNSAISALPTSPSVYIGNDSSESQTLTESLRGIPSTVSVVSLLDVDSDKNESNYTDHVNGFNGDQYVPAVFGSWLQEMELLLP
ncbi:hypothetical protein BGZ80_005721 [Entomortierella chlamydospora]|uniref:Uncharacterized protein n=1 Tax=Entomortierella chlamydospora TaxID=101097 RepID=A0A9P6N0T2_9FUNG|nr:hypothetical protein BGZ80_005721 [Entomortierella chlamydospora]